MSDTYAYQGAQDAGTATSDFNAQDFHIRQVLAEVRTATLVKIVRAPYDASGNAIPLGAVGPVGYVDVQPLVNQLDGYGNAYPHGTVYHASYYRYQGGTNAIINDPQLGDIGKFVVADRDTSSVKATSAAANPGSRRKFDLADGSYFGCSQGGTPTQGLRFLSNGIQLFDKNGNTVTTSPTGFSFVDVNGNKLVSDAQGWHFTSLIVSNTGNVIGNYGGSQITLLGHMHTQGNDSHGDAEVPTNPPTPGT